MTIFEVDIRDAVGTDGLATEFLAMFGRWGVTVGCSTALEEGKVQHVLRATCGTHTASCPPFPEWRPGLLGVLLALAWQVMAADRRSRQRLCSGHPS